MVGIEYSRRRRGASIQEKRIKLQPDECNDIYVDPVSILVAIGPCKTWRFRIDPDWNWPEHDGYLVLKGTICGMRIRSQ